MGFSLSEHQNRMILSMTGYGRGEAAEGSISAIAEVRTVNSRFLEVNARLPRTMSLRENAVKDLVRARFARGKINIVLNIVRENTSEVPLRINKAVAKGYYKLLGELRRTLKLRESVTLDHVLKFPEVLEMDEFDQGDEKEWALAARALGSALDAAATMRRDEGRELMADLGTRVKIVEKQLGDIEALATARLPQHRLRMEERLKDLVGDRSVIDAGRLELEIALLADKLDVTEECVRFHSHNKFFLEAFGNEEPSGRKLNFLVQEMNREANTIGSKAADAEIAHIVVAIKEELEKIREQLQNIE